MSYLPNKLERFMTSKGVRLNAVMQLVVHSLIFAVVACFGIYLYLSLLVIVVASLYLIFRLPMEKRVTRKREEAAIQEQVQRNIENTYRALREWQQGDSVGAIKARKLLVDAWKVQFPGVEAPLWLSDTQTSPTNDAQERILRIYYERAKEIDDALMSPYLNDGDRLIAVDRQQALASGVIEKLVSDFAGNSAAALQKALSRSYFLE